MISKDRLRGLLREPLVHFMLAGLAVFLFLGWRGVDADPSSRVITIDEAQVSRLASSFEQTWQRAPSQQEIDALIRDFIKEEIYSREAIRMGLDTDDAIIRRRLRAKMEYLARAEVESATPSAAALQAMLNKNPAKYAADAAYSFDQIYFNANDPDAAGAKAKSELRSLSANASSDDWLKMGDTISLPRSQENATRTDIAKEFGDDFARILAEQGGKEMGKWAGPFTSGFGYHLVRIRKVNTPQKPKLADVRQNLENDWRASTIETREAKGYQALLDSYTIKIAQP